MDTFDPIRCYAHAPGMATRSIADDLLLVPVRRDALQPAAVYTLNTTAARMWELMDGTRTAADIANCIAREFDGDPSRIADDVRLLMADLLSICAIAPAETRR
jgi:hypothetical protein